MKKSPPSPPLPSSRSSSSSPSNHAPLSSSNVIPVNKPKSKSKSKPKHERGKNSDKAHPDMQYQGKKLYLQRSHKGDLKLTYGTRNGSTPSRTRKADKFTWEPMMLRLTQPELITTLKFCGPEAILNFPVEMYTEEYEGMQAMSKEELVASLRRRSDGFARGVSKYRGVARHHHNGRWEARLGLALGYKYLYLGAYEEAAQAYDLAAVQFKGPDAVTNFDSCLYVNYPRQFIKLPPRPQISPLRKPKVVPLEPSDSIDQTSVSSDDIWDTITWSIIGMDDYFGAFPVLDLTVGRSNDLHGISDDVGLEDNIEQLFERFETFGSGAGEGSLVGEVGQVMEGGLKEEDMESQVNSVSYPLRISVCS